MTDFATKATNFFGILWGLFIFIHKIGFDMIKEAILDYQHYGIGITILCVILGILFEVSVFILDILVIWEICKLIQRISIIIRIKNINYHPVIGIVTEKKHKNAYTTCTYTGKIMVPMYHPEEHNIYVQYAEVKEVFDNEDLFNQYEKEDNISLILVEKLDKNNKVIERTLELPE